MAMGIYRIGQQLPMDVYFLGFGSQLCFLVNEDAVNAVH
jgi:hypothetical protein